MSVVNSKKKNPVASFGFEWAGAMARMRRGGMTGRPSRRSALLGALTASYANSSRALVRPRPAPVRPIALPDRAVRPPSSDRPKHATLLFKQRPESPPRGSPRGGFFFAPAAGEAASRAS